MLLSPPGLELLCVFCSKYPVETQVSVRTSDPQSSKGEWWWTKKSHSHDGATLKGLLLRWRTSPGRWKGPCLTRGKLAASQTVTMQLDETSIRYNPVFHRDHLFREITHRRAAFYSNFPIILFLDPIWAGFQRNTETPISGVTVHLSTFLSQFIGWKVNEVWYW